MLLNIHTLIQYQKKVKYPNIITPITARVNINHEKYLKYSLSLKCGYKPLIAAGLNANTIIKLLIGIFA